MAVATERIAAGLVPAALSFVSHSIGLRLRGVLSILGGLVLAATIGHAAEPGKSGRTASGHLEGTYRLAGAKSAAEHTIDSAIKDSTRKTNFLIRGTVRSRLHDKNQVPETITISVRGSEITTKFDDRSYTTPASGATAAVTLPDGESVKLSQRPESDRLTQVFTAEDGVRENVLARTGENGLEMTVTIHSSKLSQPLVYRLTYERLAEP